MNKNDSSGSINSSGKDVVVKVTTNYFACFIQEIEQVCGVTAQNKGYNFTGVNGKNQTDDFMEKHFNGHATGEACYKLIRYRAKHDPTDLIKAAAWIYLEWRRSQQDDKPTAD